MASFEPIVLTPTQEVHFTELRSILDRHPFAISTAMLGTGKTYVAATVALRMGFDHVIVVCPVSVMDKHRLMKETHGVPMDHILSYATLRSVKNKQPSHSLLFRIDSTTFQANGPVHSTEFAATPRLKELVRQGVLVVIDEIQNVKNVSEQFSAVKEVAVQVVRSVEDDGGRSRILVLSGSPIDKEEQAVTLFRALGVMKHGRLSSFDLHSMTKTLLGMKEIRDFCHRLNPEITTSIVADLESDDQEHARGKGNVGERLVSYKLFQQVFMRAVSSSMVPLDVGFRVTKKNGFYDIRNEDDVIALQSAVVDLKRATSYDDTTGGIAVDGARADTWGQITSALMAIESAKITTFVRIAADHLRDHPMHKVCVCVNFTSNLERLKTELSEFRPLVLDGRVPNRKRAVGGGTMRSDIINRFQAPDLEHRLLLGNTSVCSTGIDLDDKDGRYPRFCLVSPDYDTIKLYQLGHRFLRMNSRSDAELHMVFGKQAPENGVLNALARKSKVMKETVPDQADHGVVFPCDFEKFEEGGIEAIGVNE